MINSIKKYILICIGVIHPKRSFNLDYRPSAHKIAKLNKSALLSYIGNFDEFNENDSKYYHHIKYWRSSELIKILNELGYLVDVIDYRDVSYKPRKKYDLFIGHGGINFIPIAKLLRIQAKIIYLSTGAYWKFHNTQEALRFYELEKRRNFSLKPDRRIIHSEEKALSLVDGIIGTGNRFTRKTYSQYASVIMVNNCVLYEPQVLKSLKDFERGRTQFLYFAGGGNVHKGLDLLLEVFTKLDFHLWICTIIDEEFNKLFRKELSEYDNIHNLGWVNTGSETFEEIVRTCNFIILPSSSEGGVQSVVECMNQGLIPIVSEECGIDVGDCGYIFPNCSVTEITNVVKQVVALSNQECLNLSEKIKILVKTDYSKLNYSNKILTAIKNITLNNK